MRRRLRKLSGFDPVHSVPNKFRRRDEYGTGASGSGSMVSRVAKLFTSRPISQTRRRKSENERLVLQFAFKRRSLEIRVSCSVGVRGSSPRP